jgi:antitoxin FitA
MFAQLYSNLHLKRVNPRGFKMARVKYRTMFCLGHLSVTLKDSVVPLSSRLLLINECNDITDCMSSITIRNLESSVKNRLRMRAARHGRSMEEEARDILRAALAEKTHRPANLFEAIRRRMGSLGGVELDIPQRGALREPPRFEE